MTDISWDLGIASFSRHFQPVAIAWQLVIYTTSERLILILSSCIIFKLSLARRLVSKGQLFSLFHWLRCFLDKHYESEWYYSRVVFEYWAGVNHKNIASPRCGLFQQNQKLHCVWPSSPRPTRFSVHQPARRIPAFQEFFQNQKKILCFYYY